MRERGRGRLLLKTDAREMLRRGLAGGTGSGWNGARCDPADGAPKKTALYLYLP